MRLDGNVLPEGEGRGGVLAIGLPLLWGVDAVETDAFRVVGVLDFDGVTVDNSNNLEGEVGICKGAHSRRRTPTQLPRRLALVHGVNLLLTDTRRVRRSRQIDQSSNAEFLRDYR